MRASATVPAVAVLVLAACSHTSTLFDLSDRPVERPFVTASTSGLQMAADIDGQGPRIVAEFTVESPPSRLSSYDIPRLTLTTAGDNERPASALRMSTRVCRGMIVNMAVHDSHGIVRTVVNEARFDTSGSCRDVVQWVRAEFRVRAMPQPGDSAYLRFGGVTFAWRWSRPRPARY